MLEIGKKIKELRQSRSWTQEELATKLHISFQAVSKWENGVANPDLALIVSLCELFSITSDELLGIERAKDEYRKFVDALDCDVSKKNEAIAREALKVFPGDSFFTFRLINEIWFNEDVPSWDEKMKEIIALAEVAVPIATDDFERSMIMDFWGRALLYFGKSEEAFGLIENFSYRYGAEKYIERLHEFATVLEESEGEYEEDDFEEEDEE